MTSNPHPPTSPLPLVGLLAVVGLALAVFWPTLSYDLLNWDDKLHITVNPLFGDFGAAWSEAQMHVYMPVTWSLWGLAWEFGGGDPSWLHGLNVVGHVVGVLLVYAVLLRLPGVSLANTNRARWAAVLGAALFALHPVQVEPVAWVTSLKDIVSADLALLAVWLHLSGLDEGNRTAKQGLAVGAFALASLAKPTIIAVVPAVGVIHLAAGRTLWRKDLLVTAGAMIAVAVPALVLTARAQFDAPRPDVLPFDRLLVAIDVWGSAVKSVVWPGTRLGMAGRSPTAVLDGQLWHQTGAILALALGAGLVLRRRWPELLAGCVFMVVMLLPVSGLLPFGAQANTTVADRYLHLALLGPVWALSAGLCRVSKGLVWRSLAVASVALVAACASLSVAQVPAWSSDIALWEHTLKHDPDNRLALQNLPALYNEKGDFQEAIRVGRHAITVEPLHPKYNHSLGVALANTGQIDVAVPRFRAAVVGAPRWAQAWQSLIRASRDVGRPAVLVDTLKEVSATDEANFEFAGHLPIALPIAEAYLQLGDHRAVIALLRQTLATHPLSPDAHAIVGIAYGSTGQAVAALKHFEQALALDPTHPVAKRNIGVARQAIRPR